MSINTLLIPAALVALAMVFLLPVAMPALLGSQWHEAGQLARALAIGAAAGLVTSPLSFVLVAYGRAFISVALDIMRVLAVGGAGAIGLFSNSSAVTTVFFMAVAQSANYALTWWISFRTVSSPTPSS